MPCSEPSTSDIRRMHTLIGPRQPGGAQCVVGCQEMGETSREGGVESHRPALVKRRPQTFGPCGLTSPTRHIPGSGAQEAGVESSAVGSLLISESAKVNPAVEHPQAPSRNLRRSQAKGAKLDQAMKGQEGHRPADLPGP
jgi:hypothetical protein